MLNYGTNIMSLNYVELNRIISEIDISNSFFRSIKAIDYDSFILTFYKKGESTNLLVSVGSLYRLHKAAIKYNKLKAPHNLVEFIKKYLINSKVSYIKQLNNNRIIVINCIKEKVEYKIIIRLWGGFSNILITDIDNKILHLHKKSRKKNEVAGEMFIIPPPKENQKEYILNFPESEDFNAYIEKQYSRDIDQILAEQKQLKIQKSILIKQRELKGLQKKLQNYKNPNNLKTIGDLLTSNLYNIKPGKSQTTLKDWEGNDIKIQLDPALTPAENRDKYYKKYKKATSGIEHIETRISELKNEIKKLENGEIKPENTIYQKQVKRTKIGLEYNFKGYTILVGRTAIENDKLLRSMVKGNDYWLHIRDYPGGYIFIKSIKGKTIPLEVFIYAGNLALYYSKGKKNGKGDIYYTQVKYLRRVKNGKIGLVIPTQSKSLYIKMDKNIILHL